MELLSKLSENDGFWEGELKLDFWNVFFKADKFVLLNIGGDKLLKEVNIIHENGYKYLIDNQEIILKSILEKLFDIYPIMQIEYDYNEDEKSLNMPDVFSREDFIKLLTPTKIFILDIIKDDIPYIGYEFDCSWDDENGFGVMTHRNNVIKTGGAETSFLSWIAEEDLLCGER